MKIIKHGTTKKQSLLHWVCRKCDATIESSKEEGRYVHDARDGDAVVQKCPACGQENWIDLGLWPTGY